MACPSFLLLLRTIASIFMESSTRMISSVSIIITQYKHYRLKYPNVGMSIGSIYLDYYFLICTGVELLSRTECIASMGILKKSIGVGSLMTQSRQKMEGPKCCWLTPMADAVLIFTHKDRVMHRMCGERRREKCNKNNGFLCFTHRKWWWEWEKRNEIDAWLEQKIWIIK